MLRRIPASDTFSADALDAFNSHKSNDKLRDVNQARLIGLIRQIGVLSSHASQLFDNMITSVKKASERIAGVSEDIETTRAMINSVHDEHDLDQPASPTITSDWKPLKSPVDKDTTSKTSNLFSKETRPGHIREAYSNCEAPPDVAKLNPFAPEGVNLQTRYSDPMFFFKSWIQGKQQIVDAVQKGKQQVMHRIGIQAKMKPPPPALPEHVVSLPEHVASTPASPLPAVQTPLATSASPKPVLQPPLPALPTLPTSAPPIPTLPPPRKLIEQLNNKSLAKVNVPLVNEVPPKQTASPTLLAALPAGTSAPPPPPPPPPVAMKQEPLSNLKQKVDHFRKRKRADNEKRPRAARAERFDITTQLQSHIAAQRARNKTKKRKMVMHNGYTVMASDQKKGISATDSQSDHVRKMLAVLREKVHCDEEEIQSEDEWDPDEL